MRAAPVWTVDPSAAEAGDLGPVLIRDPEAGPEGATVCVIPGRLTRRVPGGGMQQVLDEDDIDCARLIAMAPRPQAALTALLRWADQLGGWDTACWDDARAVSQSLRRD